MSIKDKVLAFFKEEEGLTTVEYAVAGALVAAGRRRYVHACVGRSSCRLGDITALRHRRPMLR